MKLDLTPRHHNNKNNTTSRARFRPKGILRTAAVIWTRGKKKNGEALRGMDIGGLNKIVMKLYALEFTPPRDQQLCTATRPARYHNDNDTPTAKTSKIKLRSQLKPSNRRESHCQSMRSISDLSTGED